MKNKIDEDMKEPQELYFRFYYIERIKVTVK